MLEAPDLLQKLLMCDDIAGVPREHLEESIFRRRQWYSGRVERYGPTDEIDCQRSNPHFWLAFGATCIPAQRRAGTRQQFSHAEWLHDIVVGAKLEKSDFLLFAAAH